MEKEKVMIRMESCLDGFYEVHCRGGALLLPKSIVASQSFTGAVELRPYKLLIKFPLKISICQNEILNIMLNYKNYMRLKS